MAEKYDANDSGNTWTQSVTRYDRNGQVAFASYPMTGTLALDFATVAAGKRTQYDALGRPTRVEQDSEHGVLATTTAYLAAFQTLVTNPRDKSTTIAYKAYDQPTTDWPMWIRHEEGAYTDFDRDPFGKPKWMRRRDATVSTALVRSYYYNAAQELCMTVEPETGATRMEYDAAGNLAWSAAGLDAAVTCATRGATPPSWRASPSAFTTRAIGSPN